MSFGFAGIAGIDSDDDIREFRQLGVVTHFQVGIAYATLGDGHNTEARPHRARQAENRWSCKGYFVGPTFTLQRGYGELVVSQYVPRVTSGTG